MYVRVTTIAHALPMLASQPAAHMQWLLALGPSPPCPSASSMPLPLHGHTIKVLGTLRGTYDRFKASLASKGLQPKGPAQDRVMAQEHFPVYVCFTAIAHTLLMRVSQPAAHTQRLLALYDLGTPPLPACQFPCRPCPPCMYYQCHWHTERYVR